DEIRRRGFSATPDRQARAEALLEAYGWDQPLDILQASLNRYDQAIDEVVLIGDRGYEPHAHWVRDGWPDRWRAGIPSLADIELTSSYADPPASRQPG
ncbi:MAG: hypothetical protein WA892_05795, partial [Ornithinimicrobium sp.]